MSPIDLFFLVLSLVLGYVLYLKLGRRTGYEKNPFQYMRAFSEEKEDAAKKTVPEIEIPFITPLKHIQQFDKVFSLEKFVDFSRSVFQKLVPAYVKGELESVKGLLSSKLYDAYSAQKIEQKEKGFLSELLFFRLVSAKPKDVHVKNSIASIEILFVSEQTQVLKDDKGKVIEGDESEIDPVKELWTFEKKITQKDSVWILSQVSACADA